MRIYAIVAFVALLTGCANAPVPPPPDSPCAQNEASYECQVQRYRDVNV